MEEAEVIWQTIMLLFTIEMGSNLHSYCQERIRWSVSIVLEME
jgi:hypothetical protein